MSRQQGHSAGDGRSLRISYGPTPLAGLLLGSFLNAFYHPGWQPGLLIYYLYELFLGSYRFFWRFHVAVLVVPIIMVNLLNYGLYRRGRFPSERFFFLLLSVLLNGLIFFAGVNILLCHFN